MRQGKAPSRPRHGNKNLFVHRPPEGKDSVIDYSYRRVSRILIQEDSGTSRSTFPPAVFVWATPFLCVFRNSDLSRQRHSGKLWSLVTDSESISFHRKLRIFTGVAVGQHAHSKQRKRSKNPIIPTDTDERPSKPPDRHGKRAEPEKEFRPFFFRSMLSMRSLRLTSSGS